MRVVKVRRYILLKSLLSLLVGLAVGMTLHFLNVDLAFLFAMLTFIANYSAALPPPPYSMAEDRMKRVLVVAHGRASSRA